MASQTRPPTLTAGSAFHRTNAMMQKPMIGPTQCRVTVRQGLLQVIELGLIETRRGRGGGSLVATTSTMEASLRRVAVTRGAGSAATGVRS
jgi:hypothetical protein